MLIHSRRPTAATRQSEFSPGVVALAVVLGVFGLVTPAGADTLSAEVLVRRVLDRNAELGAMRSTVDAAQARIEPAGSLPDPQVSANLAPRTVDGYTTPAGRERGSSGTIQISQSLPWPGTLGLREDAARHEALAADSSVESLRLRLKAVTRRRYAEWAYVHEALAVNADNQALVAELREVAEQRYAAGSAEQQDVLKAEVELRRLREQALAFKRRKTEIKAATNALLNREPDHPLPPPATLPEPTAPPAYRALRDAALARHPELEGFHQRIAAHKEREALAEKAFYPDLKLMAGNNDFRPASETRFTVGVGISLPLDRDKRHAALDAARAETMEVRYRLTDRRARLLSQIQSARAAAEQTRQTIMLYRDELIPRTRESLSAARSAYSAGGGDFLDIIAAEREKLQAELQLHRTRADHFIASAELTRWAGGDLSAAGDSEIKP